MGCVVSDLHTAKLPLTQANIQVPVSKASPSLTLMNAKDFSSIKKNIASPRSGHPTADTGLTKGQASEKAPQETTFSKVLNSCAESRPTVCVESENLGSEFSMPEERFRSERNFAEHSIKSSLRKETPPKISKPKKNHNPQKKNFRIKKHLQRQAPAPVSPSRLHTSIESCSMEGDSEGGYSPSDFSFSLPNNMIPAVQVKNVKSETNFERPQLAHMSPDDRENVIKTFRKTLSCSDNFACSGNLERVETPGVVQLLAVNDKKARRFACFKIGSGLAPKFLAGQAR
jgi:hypothetical protein